VVFSLLDEVLSFFSPFRNVVSTTVCHACVIEPLLKARGPLVDPCSSPGPPLCGFPFLRQGSLNFLFSMKRISSTETGRPFFRDGSLFPFSFFVSSPGLGAIFFLISFSLRLMVKRLNSAVFRLPSL